MSKPNAFPGETLTARAESGRVYQLHFDDPETPLDETLEALDTIVRASRARYIGVSNFLAYRLTRATGRAEYLDLTRLASIQNRDSLLFRQIEQELLPLAREEGIAVIPFQPARRRPAEREVPL